MGKWTKDVNPFKTPPQLFEENGCGCCCSRAWSYLLLLPASLFALAKELACRKPHSHSHGFWRYRKTPVEPELIIHRIRITLTSCNVKSLEKVCADLTRGPKGKNLKVWGQVRTPTKTLRITARKTPGGESSNIWDWFQMRTHTQLNDLHSPEIAKQVTFISTELRVKVEVTTAEA